MTSKQGFLDAMVEAEEFAGGPMCAPEPVVTIHGNVQVESRSDGSWFAGCTRCNAGTGSTAGPADDDASNYDDEQYDRLLAEHRTCTIPMPTPAPLPLGVNQDLQALHDLFGPRPAPSRPAGDAPKPTVWVVKQASGGDIRVLAERHTTYARPDGTELRFYNGTGDNQHRVATVRAGSWHWVVAATALDPKEGEPTC